MGDKFCFYKDDFQCTQQIFSYQTKSNVNAPKCSKAYDRYLLFLGTAPDTDIGRVYVNDPDDWDLPDKTFKFKNPGKWGQSFRLDANTGMITMLSSIYLPNEINTFELDFIVEDPVHRQFGKDAVSATVSDFCIVFLSPNLNKGCRKVSKIVWTRTKQSQDPSWGEGGLLSLTRLKDFSR